MGQGMTNSQLYSSLILPWGRGGSNLTAYTEHALRKKEKQIFCLLHCIGPRYVFPPAQ